MRSSRATQLWRDGYQITLPTLLQTILGLQGSTLVLMSGIDALRMPAWLLKFLPFPRFEPGQERQQFAN